VANSPSQAKRVSQAAEFELDATLVERWLQMSRAEKITVVAQQNIEMDHPLVRDLLDAFSAQRHGRRRIVVAMSGGVDSSVAAALLHHAGHEVLGITLQLYDHGEATGRKGACCAGQDIQDARNVAELLSIPHYVLDYEKRFADAVINTFAESYIAGETPIPCVACNQQIKFRDLLETAKDLGASVLATGHYIQKRDGDEGPRLHRAADADRDQSYFLFATTPEQLETLWFPLGGVPKADVRDIARALGLPISDKPDSQDICFVPKGHYADVIERLKPGAAKPGNIVHIDGRELGHHDGIINYTIGQRRGLGIPDKEPLYVLSLSAERNEVVVGPRKFLRTRGLVLRNVNWLGRKRLDEVIADGDEIFARIRSTQSPQPANLSRDQDGAINVVLADGEEGIASGQACVFYSDGSPEAQVLGGGWIARTIKPNLEPHAA
jgi:tRNA-uridine 2-sulfurtransferase